MVSLFEKFMEQYLGIRSLEKIARDIEKEVVVEAYPKEAAEPISELPKVKIVEGKKPEEDWKEPYLRIYGSLEGRATFYGPLKNILTYGFAEMIAIASKDPEKRERLPVPIKLRVFVYPGTPCYKVLKECARLVRDVENVEVELVHVDGGKRLAMLYELGVKKVPTYVVDGKIINIGSLTKEELMKKLMKIAAEKAFEMAKKELLKEIEKE